MSLSGNFYTDFATAVQLNQAASQWWQMIQRQIDTGAEPPLDVMLEFRKRLTRYSRFEKDRDQHYREPAR